MATKPMTNSYVEHISLAQEMENRIALATVRIGDVTIRGVAVCGVATEGSASISQAIG